MIYVEYKRLTESDVGQPFFDQYRKPNNHIVEVYCDFTPTHFVDSP